MTRAQKYRAGLSTGKKAEQGTRNVKWAREHPEARAVMQKRYTDKTRQIMDLAKDRPCADCKQSYPPVVMDFDHVRGEKLFNVSAHGGRSRKSVILEIEKCEVVCANCHRLRTESRGYRK
jgi:hypothetical protein